MNPMRAKPPRYGLSELYVGGTGGTVQFRQLIGSIKQFQATLYMSGIHAACRGVCSAVCRGVLANLRQGRHHPFARAIKQCSFTVELPVGHPKSCQLTAAPGPRQTSLLQKITRLYQRPTGTEGNIGRRPTCAVAFQAH
jgi:hypothetical protein